MIDDFDLFKYMLLDNLSLVTFKLDLLSQFLSETCPKEASGNQFTRTSSSSSSNKPETKPNKPRDSDDESETDTEEGFKCPKADGLYADPASCKKFYLCGAWKAYHQSCPPSLFFDDKLKFCTFKTAELKCGPIENSESDEESQKFNQENLKVCDRKNCQLPNCYCSEDGTMIPANYSDWAEEVIGLREILLKFGNGGNTAGPLTRDNIIGLRSPYIKPGGDPMYEMAHDFGLAYDSSLVTPKGNVPYWPFTWDYRQPFECSNQKQKSNKDAVSEAHENAEHGADIVENNSQIKSKLKELNEINDCDTAYESSQSSNDEETSLEIILSEVSDLTSDSDTEENEELLERKNRNSRTRKNLIEKRNEKGETPLHRACIEGNLLQVEKLIEKGHKINPRDNCGWLPIHEASNHGFTEIVELLIKHNAWINDPGGRDCDGTTPLHDACTNGHTDVIRVLLKNGANVTCVNYSNKTPLDCLIDFIKRSSNLSSYEKKDFQMLINQIRTEMKKKGYIEKKAVKRPFSSIYLSSDSSQIECDEHETSKSSKNFSPPHKSSCNRLNSSSNLRKNIEVDDFINSDTTESFKPIDHRIESLIDENNIVDDWLDDDLGLQNKSNKKTVFDAYECGFNKEKNKTNVYKPSKTKNIVNAEFKEKKNSLFEDDSNSYQDAEIVDSSSKSPLVDLIIESSSSSDSNNFENLMKTHDNNTKNNTRKRKKQTKINKFFDIQNQDDSPVIIENSKINRINEKKDITMDNDKVLIGIRLVSDSITRTSFQYNSLHKPPEIKGNFNDCLINKGSTTFKKESTKTLCEKIGVCLARKEKIVLVTSGTLGVSDTVAYSFFEERKKLRNKNEKKSIDNSDSINKLSKDKSFIQNLDKLIELKSLDVIHILPDCKVGNLKNKYRVSEDGTFDRLPYGYSMYLGDTIEDRDSTVAQVFPYCILIEGGCSSAKLAQEFIYNENHVIPVCNTGGAAAVSSTNKLKMIQSEDTTFKYPSFRIDDILNNNFDTQDDNCYLDGIYIPPPPKKPNFSGDKTGNRLVITHIENINFKSYAGRQLLGPFQKSFTSIVGPNGSGKSNGDDKFEIVPGSEFKVSRTAHKDNSSYYMIGERKTNFKEVGVVLSSHGIDLRYNRFLILQGEVEQISLMKPKGETEDDTGFLEFLEEIIGSSRLKEPIDQFFSKVQEINEVRAEKLNRVKAIQVEKDALEVLRNEAIDYLEKQNKKSYIQNDIYQINKFNNYKVYEEAKVIFDEANEIFKKEMEKVKEIIDEKNKINANLEKLKEELEKLTSGSEELNEKFKEAERKDADVRTQIKNNKNKGKKLVNEIEKEKERLEELTKEPEKLQKEIDELETKKNNLDEELKLAEEKLSIAMNSIQDDTKSLQEEKEKHEKAFAELQKDVNTDESNLKIVQSKLNLLLQSDAKEKCKLNELNSKIESLEVEIRKKEQLLKANKEQIPFSEKKISSANEQIIKIESQQKILVDQNMRLAQKLDEAKSSKNAHESKGQVLNFLMKMKKSGKLNGILGRLGDLGGIDKKYDVAISTACGQLDFIVVDTMENAKKCLQSLRENRIGTATFIGLDKMETYKSYCKPLFSGTPENVPRLFDLVQVQEECVRPAFYFALRDTLVADDLEIATRIGLGKSSKGKRWRVVTLDGKLVETSGAMTAGGRPIKGRMGTEAIISNDNDNEIREMETNLASSQEEIRNLQYKKKILDSEKNQLENDLKVLRQNLPKFEQELQRFNADFKQTKILANEQEEIVKNIKPDSQTKELQKNIEVLEKNYNRSKGKATKVEEILDELKKKIQSVIDKKVGVHKSKVDGLKKELNFVNSSVTKLVVAQKTNTRNLDKCKAKIESLDKEIDVCHETIDKLKEEMKELNEKGIKISEDYKKSLEEKDKLGLEIKKLEDEIKGLDKKENSKNMENVDKKYEMEKLLKDVEEKELNVKKWDYKIKELELHTIDGEKPEDFRILENEEIEKLNKNFLQKEISDLDKELSQLKPNFASIEEYKKKEEIYLSRIDELNEVTKLRDKLKENYDKIRLQRLCEFKEGFEIISLKLKEMYRMITMGGDAELEWVDSLDPFSEGINFTKEKKMIKTEYQIERFVKAAVRSLEYWLTNQNSMSFVICEENQALDGQPKILSRCTACDEAKYGVILTGLWSRNTHPRDFPKNAWDVAISNVVGASHSNNFHIFSNEGYATEPLRRLAEDGETKDLSQFLGNRENINSIR
ncbi:hypothetical protein RND71_043331 [Anisodus tanguticus]|uniref:Uncharacterized protein n=1 Tax=Anisodus tanguticus TaxID=243964 RepID=A0AAE1UU88_9SOLA|nr:hypothetical protein RND71_043331 [Anisodus tanguticus]